MYAQALQILLAIRQQAGGDATSPTLESIAAEHPWYATAWLGAAIEQEGNLDYLRRAALTVHDPLRLQLLVHPWPEVPERLPAEPQVVPGEEPATMLVQPQAETVIEPVPAITTNTKEAPQNQAGTETATTASPVAVESSIEQETVADEKIEDTGSDDELLFQPYYTVDYFASQGIKVDAMLQPTNRFDRQLMSFTQWLKTMKKLNYDNEAKPSDPHVDAQASASVSPKEIITEAMADVLMKQGKWDQAEAVYSKLTLLHPEKSVFFASQIQKIKERQ